MQEESQTDLKKKKNSIHGHTGAHGRNVSEPGLL